MTRKPAKAPTFVNMEYRRLTLEELKELEPEFKRFLATHQIQPEDWETIKAQEPERMESIIEQFSDIVFDKVLGTVHYLEYRKSREITVFYFAEDQLYLAGLQIQNNEADIDLNHPDVLNQLAADAGSILREGDVAVFTSSKPYQRTRKQELLHFWESGCTVSNASLYHSIQSLKAGTA